MFTDWAIGLLILGSVCMVSYETWKQLKRNRDENWCLPSDDLRISAPFPNFMSMENTRTDPRPLSLVKFDFSKVSIEDKVSYYSHFDTKGDERLMFVGEIPNMPGHCVIHLMRRLTDNSEYIKTYVGYHTSDFIELTDDEL